MPDGGTQSIPSPPPWYTGHGAGTFASFATTHQNGDVVATFAPPWCEGTSEKLHIASAQGG
jgi:hypothetical protein